MESNLLLEQYSWYKKQQLAKAPFECLLNADIEPNPHQVNAFCAAIQALKTGGIILADEVGLGKTIEAGLVLNYVLDNEAKKVLISLPATLRKQWEVELLEKFGRQAVILDRYTVEHDLANVQTHLGNADEVSIVIASYDYSSKLIKRFPHSLLDELEMRWEDEQKLNGLSSVHSMGFRQFIFYLAHKVDFIAEIFLCTMILFGNVGAQPAASFLLKFASFAKFLKQPESLCCFCTNQIFNFFSCNTAVFQCILKNE